MGMVRRRTRRRTMMVAGGLAYERGKAQGQQDQSMAEQDVRGAGSARPAAAGTERRRRNQRARASGVVAPVGCPFRRRVRRRQAAGPQR